MKLFDHPVSCFGFIDGRLFLGTRHHMAIMDFVLKHGYDWPSLIAAKQTWGWIQAHSGHYYRDRLLKDEIVFRISTDAGAVDTALTDEVAHAFKVLTGYEATEDPHASYGASNSSYAPSLNKDSESGTGYGVGAIPGCVVYDPYTGFKGWVDTSNDNVRFPPPPDAPEWLPEGLHMVPTKFVGPGFPPPKKKQEPSEPEPIAPKEDQIIIMKMKDGSFWRSEKKWSWADSHKLWKTLDDRRIAGLYPSIDWFGVRAIDDPQWKDKPQWDIDILMPNPKLKVDTWNLDYGPGSTCTWITSSQNTYPITAIEDGNVVITWQGNKYSYSIEQFNSLIKKRTVIILDSPKPPKKQEVPGLGGPQTPSSSWKESAWTEQKGYPGGIKFVYDLKNQDLATGDGHDSHHMDLLQELLAKSPNQLVNNVEDEADYFLYHDMDQENPRFIFGQEFPNGSIQVFGDKVDPNLKQIGLSAYENWHNGQHKVASLPPFMYHTSDPARRSSIEQHGIHPVHDFTGYNAVYLSIRPLMGDNQDIWKVYTKDLNLVPDVSTPGFEDEWYMCYNVISPDRLRLMEPWELDSSLGDIYAKKADYDEDSSDYDEDEDLTEMPTSDIIKPVTPFGEPKNIDGWDVYEMQSGEYPSHHAILIDRGHKKMYVNYYGHHHPMISQGMKAGIMDMNMYETANGHYRLAPSPDEPFSEGWGWHGNEADEDEKVVLKHVMKAYHGVENLKDAWETTASANPIYEWVHVCNKASKVLWKSVWDRSEDRMVIWNTCGDEKHHTAALIEIFPDSMTKTGNLKNKGMFVQAEGTYVNISYVLAPGAINPNDDKDHVRSLLKKALVERYPAAKKEATLKKDSYQRFMVSTTGDVMLGPYDSHAALIQDWLNSDAADKYMAGEVTPTEDYPFIGGGFIEDDGKIVIIHSVGEPDFDPYTVGKSVYDKAKTQGEPVTGEVVYKDWRNQSVKDNSLMAFNVGEGA